MLAFCVVIIGLSGIFKPSSGLSLIFLRYSDDFDTKVEGVAFLLLTNASDKSYVVVMPGITNPVVASTFFARRGVSYSVDCEFKDQTANGWTNWTQEFSPVPSPVGLELAKASPPGPQEKISIRVPTSTTVFHVLGPYNGVTIRVPTLAVGQRRKVAVLCQEVPGLRRSSFWQSRLGGYVLRILPRRIASPLVKPGRVLKGARALWCDHELTPTETRTAAP